MKNNMVARESTGRFKKKKEETNNENESKSQIREQIIERSNTPSWKEPTSISGDSETKVSETEEPSPPEVEEKQEMNESSELPRKDPIDSLVYPSDSPGLITKAIVGYGVVFLALLPIIFLAGLVWYAKDWFKQNWDKIVSYTFILVTIVGVGNVLYDIMTRTGLTKKVLLVARQFMTGSKELRK